MGTGNTKKTGGNPSVASLIQLHVIEAMLRSRTATVGKITAYNAETELCNVQPMIMDSPRAGLYNEPVAIPEVHDVKVVFPRGSSWYVSFPLEVGDTVLLVVLDRSIDVWLQTGGGADKEPVNPIDSRHNNINDVIAIPGLFDLGSPSKSKHKDCLEIGITSDTAHCCMFINDSGGLTIEGNSAIINVGEAQINAETASVSAEFGLSLLGGMVGVGATADAVTGGDTMAIRDTKVFITSLVDAVALWVNAGTATSGDITALKAALTVTLSSTVGHG